MHHAEEAIPDTGVVLKFRLVDPAETDEFLSEVERHERLITTGSMAVDDFRYVVAFLDWARRVYELRGTVGIEDSAVKDRYATIATALRKRRGNDPLAAAYYALLLEFGMGFANAQITKSIVGSAIDSAREQAADMDAALVEDVGRVCELTRGRIRARVERALVDIPIIE